MKHADEIRFLKMSIADLIQRMDAERAYVTKIAVAVDQHMKDADKAVGRLRCEVERLDKTDLDIHKTVMSVGRAVKDIDQELKTLFMYSRETMSKVFPGVIDRLGELHETLEPAKKD